GDVYPVLLKDVLGDLLGRFDAAPQRRLDRLRLVLRLRRPVPAGWPLGLPRACLGIRFLFRHGTPFFHVKSIGTDTLSAKTMICTRERGWLRLATHPFGTNLPSVTRLHFPKQAHEDRADPRISSAGSNYSFKRDRSQ